MASKGCNREDGIKACRHFGLSRKPTNHPRWVHPPAVRGLLTAARESDNPCDFALVAMLGPLGLRIFEATSADIADLDEAYSLRQE